MGVHLILIFYVIKRLNLIFFWNTAISLGADYIATGHYCRKSSINFGEDNKQIYSLLSGLDKNKDQSYFLCQLSQFQLSKTLFPIGELEKSNVRKIASDIGLVTADKKDSQGLCFIGKVRLPEFLMQKLKPKKGDIIQIPNDFKKYNNLLPSFKSKALELRFRSKKINYDCDDGIVMGTHLGAHFFTIGQRKGLSVGGTKKPLFVIATDVDKNIVYVGEGKDHPGLLRNVLYVNNDDIHWVRDDLKLYNGDNLEVLARIRYRQTLQKAYIHKFNDGLYVEFLNLQTAITEGQFVAWYIGEELVGSGVIS